MKNEDDAMDVVQDSYIKAWKYLGSLKDPELFPAWMGRIVANTAKNALAKKRPMLFSELERENEDGDAYVYDIEDERTDRQPELNFTQQETQELVREMIGSLTDEQRLCILMYHLEGQSIRGIAQTFNVSENTVKSRLLYGRKALKKRAEELQKRGWQLYGVAPVSLLMYLLLSEKGSKTVMADSYTARIEQKSEILKHTGTNPSVQKAGQNTARYLGNHPSDQQWATAFGQVSRETGKFRDAAAYSAKAVTKQATKQAAGQTIKKTSAKVIAGRVIAAVAALAVIGGATAGLAIYRNRQIGETVQNREAGMQEPSVQEKPSAQKEPLETLVAEKTQNLVTTADTEEKAVEAPQSNANSDEGSVTAGVPAAQPGKNPQAVPVNVTGSVGESETIPAPETQPAPKVNHTEVSAPVISLETGSQTVEGPETQASQTVEGPETEAPQTVEWIETETVRTMDALEAEDGFILEVADPDGDNIMISASPEEKIIMEASDSDGEDSPLTESESQPSGNTGTMAGLNPSDDQYPLLIAGSLSKADLEMVLAYGPQVIPEGELTDDEARNILNALAMAWDPAQNRRYIEPAVSTAGRPLGYVQSDMNRFFEAFSDYSFTEDNDSDLEYGVNVEDGYIYFYPATLNYSAETQIHSMEYSAEEMRIRYSYHYILYPEATGVAEDYTVEKEAILAPIGNGQYRIRRIVEVQQDQSQDVEAEFVPAVTNEETYEALDETVDSGEGLEEASDQTDVSFADVYALFLQSVENGEDIYGYYDAEETTYTLADIDLDGIPELLLSEETLYDVFVGCTISVYDCDVTGALQRIAGKQTAVNAIPVLEGEGFYLMDHERLRGVSCYYRTIIQDGKLLPFGSPDYEVALDEPNALGDQYFDWHAVSELDYLYSYGA